MAHDRGSPPQVKRDPPVSRTGGKTEPTAADLHLEAERIEVKRGESRMRRQRNLNAVGHSGTKPVTHTDA